jgi:hypothetical protein
MGSDLFFIGIFYTFVCVLLYFIKPVYFDFYPKKKWFYRLGLRVMVFNSTFNNISVISVLLVGKTRVPGKKPPTYRKSITGLYTDISCLGGVFAKNTSRKTKNFPSRNLVSGLVFFADTLPNMIYLFNYTEYYLEHWINK